MRSTRRRVLAGLAALAVLGACRDPRRDGTPRIAYVVPDTASNFSVELTLGYQAGAARVGGVEASVSGPEVVDGTRQVRRFEEMADDRIDGISVTTLSPELFARPMAAAVKAGIQLIAVGVQAMPTSGVPLLVSNDNYELGRMLADAIIERLPARATGTVVLGTIAPGVPTMDYRTQGMRERFGERLPGVTVTGPYDTAQDGPANRAAWVRLATANPNALAFLGNGDPDAYNLASVRTELGARWLAGAFDLDAQSLAAVRDGTLTAVVSPEHYLKAAVAGWIQAEHATSGDPLPDGWIYVPGLPVTAENVESIIVRQASAEARAAQLGAGVERLRAEAGSRLRPITDAR
ncbi:sugar ABC transporter substrate-binding protein [Catenuloplanes atrovinosus]|uniref:Ribose transport system substrate-binding protein n=1 Tax=Catenuloplanes atrovinosus TaxID=137266 RepID=A0AAE3YUT0_9ACTN|nr:sugar ABC transporter substrate-binding protein [Catenuloplanes atrovinosus]MDR7278331.1 ribose transport system substrate-binding protein [Catenuloplanes atrovinosus]